jgi:hypothetical protein
MPREKPNKDLLAVLKRSPHTARADLLSDLTLFVLVAHHAHVNLAALPVELRLAREVDALKALKDLGERARDGAEHGRERDTDRESDDLL